MAPLKRGLQPDLSPLIDNSLAQFDIFNSGKKRIKSTTLEKSVSPHSSQPGPERMSQTAVLLMNKSMLQIAESAERGFPAIAPGAVTTKYSVEIGTIFKKRDHGS